MTYLDKVWSKKRRRRRRRREGGGEEKGEGEREGAAKQANIDTNMLILHYCFRSLAFLKNYLRETLA